MGNQKRQRRETDSGSKKNNKKEKKQNDDSEDETDLNKKNMNELETLYSFMRQFKNESKKQSGGKNLPWTHTMTDTPFGCYDIPDDYYGKFLTLYRKAIHAGYEPHIAEKQKESGPIIIDFDFKHSKKHSSRVYTEKDIRNIIRLYNRVLKKYLDINPSDIEAYVFEKSKPDLRGGEYCDGIHVMYPFICAKASLRHLMREKFIELVEENGIFENLHLTNSLQEIFDKQVVFTNAWMLYGSKKKSTSQRYVLTHIYQSANNKIYDILIESELKNKSFIDFIIDAARPRRFIDESELTPYNNNTDPSKLQDEFNQFKEKIKDTGKIKNVDDVVGTNTDFITAVSEENLVLAKNLVALFTKDRATQYYTWYQVGLCLHNIDYRLLDDWIEFSKKCKNKFKPGECEMMWKKMKSSNYTMASLHYWASKDNPKKFLKMKEERIKQYLKDGLDASHTPIARLIMEKYKFFYKCASIKTNMWFEYQGHKWVEVEAGYTLRKRISDELVKDYADMLSYTYDKMRDEQGFDKEVLEKRADRIGKVIKSLNNSSFKTHVIRECADIAYDPKFLNNLDENPYLICFENGVYDLSVCGPDNDYKGEFRDGCPDDYISKCTNYPYIEYDDNDEYAKEIHDFLKKIQTRKNIREYLLTLLSTCIAGSISEESFYVLTGSGANGKSKLMELLKLSLGDLYLPMDVRILTEKRGSSSAASPELADKKGIRATTLDEPKATDDINTAFMKIMTGGDTIQARAMYKDQVYFKPQFKPFLLCNSLPSIKEDDDGTWRRMKVLPFGSKFYFPNEFKKEWKKNGVPEDHFPADRDISEKLKDWKQTFMGILIQYYAKYKKEGLIHPKIVLSATEQYRKRCDVYQDFLGDTVEKVDDDKSFISTANLHELMRGWYRKNHDGKCPGTKDLRNYLQKRMGGFKKDAIYGYRIRGSNEEDMNNDLESF